VIVRTIPVFSLALVAGLLYVAGSALGMRWQEGNFIVEKPEGLAHALNNILDASLRVWSGILNIADPVIASYGAVWTAVMTGLLLTGSLYLIFARR
jgi:hypothetical protein